MSGTGVLDQAGDWIRKTFDDVQDTTDRLLDRRLRLAITGLRRSGKTVFTTCLVHHLLDGRDLPYLDAVHHDRYLGGRIKPVQGRAFPFERYEANLQAARPKWPKPTDRLTTLELELRFRGSGWFDGVVRPYQSIYLEIIDYPGEWLLDLPLLDQTYETFSEIALELAVKGERVEAAQPWLQLLESVDPSEPVPDALVDQLCSTFRTYLRTCQQTLGLSLIQPGRLAETSKEYPEFCPLPPGPAPKGSLRFVMGRRYVRYCDEVVRPFYEEHFSRFDRQVVLVDLFASLNAGKEHFDDTHAALRMILESFRYGRSNMLSRLLSPSIDKVLFVASKADHVAANQHANLKELLETMISPARRNARFEAIDNDVLVVASLRSTDTVKTKYDGQILSCLRGHLVGRTDRRGEDTVIFPGEIPSELPNAQDWRDGRFRFRDFAPRPLQEGRPNQHIRLDQAVQFLIGDKLA